MGAIVPGAEGSVGPEELDGTDDSDVDGHDVADAIVPVDRVATFGQALVLPSVDVEPDRPLILVVDDNAINLAVLQRQLSMLACNTATAVNGRIAVDMVEALAAAPASSQRLGRKFALILMDLHMPVMTGLEAARAIRSLEQARAADSGFATAPLPIIAVSADNPEVAYPLVLAAGMQDYLRKPFVLSDLRAVVAKWLHAAAL